MVQTFGTFKSLADRLDREAIERTRRAAANAAGDGAEPAEDTPLSDAANLPTMTHQERVNAEMFKAIEILGRKLDRHNEVQSDAREALNRRLALIESAATVDEKTGKLYLPVVMEAPAVAVAPAAGVPKWMLATTLLSGAVAVLALAIVVFRPVPPSLTEQQLAVLNALAETRMGALTGPLAPNAKDSGNWQPVEAAEDTPPPASELATPAPTAPAVTTPADTDTADTAAQASPQDIVQDSAQAETGDETQATTPPQPQAPQAEVSPALDTDSQTQAAQTAPATPDTDTATDTQTAAPVAAAPAAAPAAPAAPEAVTKAVTADEETPAPATQKQAAAKPEKAKASTTPAQADVPPPLVAGLDIGRDASLPKDLVPVETRAMEGVPAAQHDLATLYAAGKQVPQNYKRAVYWFAQAAEGGIANADYNLGVMFQQGLGVKKDAAKAIGWYAKAADLGHPEAMYNLGIAYIEGVGTKRNVDEGIKYFSQAADAGVAQAAFNLGVLYESGFGGGIDLATARSWYEKAAKTGHKDARAALARLDAQMGQQAEAPPIAAPAKSAAKSAAPAAAALTDADLVEPPQGSAPAYANDLVGKVQRALIRSGLLPAPASGVMDARTEDAIRAWQAAHNLPADGVPSLDLLGQLNAEAAAKTQSGSSSGDTSSPPPRIPHHQF